MKKLFMFVAVLCTSLIAVGQEVAIKPGIIGLDVEGNLVREIVWKRYGKGFAPEFKDGTATFSSDNDKKIQGLSAKIILNQSEAKPITFSAESKAEKVSVKGKTEHNYSLFLDITYTDNTIKYAVIAPFKVGSHDWEKSEMYFTPEKPIKLISAHMLFRFATGTASFRNVFVAETK